MLLNTDQQETSEARHDPEQPCRALWAAVLKQAVDDAMGFVKANAATPTGLIQHQATEWINDDRVSIGSFLWICSYLGLNASAVRERVAASAAACRDPERLGEKLSLYRAGRDMTQRQIARRLGISVSAVSLIENGRRIASDSIKSRIRMLTGKGAVHAQ